jgi:hypothetical protein
MTTTPSDPATALPGRPPVVDLATWQAARDELLVREKAHTRGGHAIAAARRRLPMVELDGTVEVVGPDGPVPFQGLARGPSGRLAGRWAWLADLLVLALGRRRRRYLGPGQPARAAVDPPRRDPRGDLGRLGHHH